MTRWVIDASVLVKLFIEEEGSSEAAALLKPTDELFAPDLLWAEVSNIIWKYARRGEVSAGDAKAIVADMLQMPIETESCRELTESALEIAIATNRTVYDALYLALAIDRQMQMLTADEKLANALSKTSYAGHIQCV
jgi:predicted nucleic acid-binding protein